MSLIANDLNWAKVHHKMDLNFRQSKPIRYGSTQKNHYTGIYGGYVYLSKPVPIPWDLT